MLIGAPPDSEGAANLSGWSNEEIFLKYMDFFIKHTKPSKDDPVLLVLDNVDSHCTYPVVQKAKDHGIIMVTFHPHTSHKMQPLDRTVFGPLKIFYNQAMNDWMSTSRDPNSNNAGRPVTIYDVAGFVGKAFPSAFTPNNIESGFRVSGLYPFDSNIFQEHEFLPSNVTDRPLEAAPGPSSSGESIQPQTTSSILPQPEGSATMAQPKPTTPGNESGGNPNSTITPEMVRPFLKAAPRTQHAGRGRQKGKSRILTDTPEKNALQTAYESKEEKKKKQAPNVNKRKNKIPTAPRQKKTNRKLFAMSSSSDEELNFDISSPSSTEDFSIQQDIEAEELEKKFENDNISEGDFIFVKVAGKKVVRHFVAQVTEVTPDSSYNVKYLKMVRCHQHPKFTFYNDDEYEVGLEDIVFKLPPPIVGSTDRQSQFFSFEVEFSGFLMG